MLLGFDVIHFILPIWFVPSLERDLRTLNTFPSPGELIPNEFYRYLKAYKNTTEENPTITKTE